MSKFQFKQFTVEQDKCAMKIGTDAVLLGAWCPVNSSIFSILDIGAGTGILSLMLAQRTNAQQIDAIEIEENAYEQCVLNFENSVWNDRLFCFHAGIDEFIEEPEDEYDLIVSNPPFYTEDYKSENKERDLARFEEALPFNTLLEASDLLLSDNGILAVIIPYKEENKFSSLAKEFELYPFKITRVKGTENAEIKRSLMAFSRIIQEVEIDQIVIENSRHNYTNEYISLTKEFYIKM